STSPYRCCGAARARAGSAGAAAVPGERLGGEQRLCGPRRVVQAERVAGPDRGVAEVRERRAGRASPAPAELVTGRGRSLRELRLRAGGRGNRAMAAVDRASTRQTRIRTRGTPPRRRPRNADTTT